MDELTRFRRTHLGRALARARWAFEARFEEAIRGCGFEDFRQSDVDVIARLPARGARLSDLAERSPTTKQALSKAVRSLEQRGYVERRPDPHDGRAQRIMLSNRGRALLEAAVDVIRRIEAEWAETLGEDELERLRSTLLRAADAVGPPEYL